MIGAMRCSKPSQINVLLEQALELANLRLDDCLAISLPRIFVIVVLMVPFCHIKLLNFLNLSHYLIRISWVFPLSCHLTQNFLDLLVLLLVALLVHDDGTVLRAGVVALAIESGWVVDVHEDIKKSWIGGTVLEYWMTFGSK